MKILEISGQSVIDEAANVLLDGGVVIFPTETVYGIGVIASDAEAEERLRDIKGREESKPFQLLVSGSEQAERYATVSEEARSIIREFWPGPLTLVLPGVDCSTVGLRSPDSQWLLLLLKHLDRGIVATSANFAGQPAAVCADDVLGGIGRKVDLIIDGGRCACGTASTVARLSGKSVDILREGAISAAAMERIIR